MTEQSKNVKKELERWAKEVRRGAASLAILALLSKRRAYGYEIVKELEDRTEFLSLEQGTVYPLLRRMEKRDLLTSECDHEDPAKPKKYYVLSDQGKSALDQMSEIWSLLTDEMDNIIMEVPT
jgi:PadR family transcriptional regulator PadR